MHSALGSIRISLIAVLLIVVTACSPQHRNHGYVPVDEDLAAITVGRDSRETVSLAVGRPTTAGVLDDGAWYYVQSRFRHYGYLAPREIERQVVAISFDGRGVVSNIERFGLENGRIVTLSRRVTSSSVRDTTFLRQLMGNLGRVNLGQLLGG